MKEVQKKRIAFLGIAAHTLPSHRILLERLSEHYEIIVYAEVYRNIVSANAYRIIAVPAMRLPYKLRMCIFFFLIVRDHILRRFDLIHCLSTFPTGFCGIILSRILRIPVVVSLDGAEATSIPEIGFGDLLTPKRATLSKWAINKADAVIVLTNFALDEVRRNLNIGREIHVIPRGIDRQRFKYTEKAVQTPLRILSVGYLSPVKDPDTLLKAFRKLDKIIDCILIHIGEDFLNGQVQDSLANSDLSGKVTFKGLTSYDLVPAFYAEADLLLLTSRFESQGVVVNEAMACGVLVCGTHVGLMADLSNECCMTVNPGDHEMLAQTIVDMMQKPDEMARLRRNALSWCLQHDVDWTAKKHREIYDTLIKPVET